MAVALALGLVLATACSSSSSNTETESASTTTTPATSPTTNTSSTTTTSTTTTTTTTLPLVDPRTVGQPWGTTVSGVLTFKGNPTRTFNGTGPVPVAPRVLWTYPNQRMCGESSEYGEVRTWCGTGWVGQPAIFERDGRTWVVFGAYDYKIHFVDAMTGEEIIPPFPTRDIAKGTVTVDRVLGLGGENAQHHLRFERPTPANFTRIERKQREPAPFADADGGDDTAAGIDTVGASGGWLRHSRIGRGAGRSGNRGRSKQEHTPSRGD